VTNGEGEDHRSVLSLETDVTGGRFVIPQPLTLDGGGSSRIVSPITLYLVFIKYL